MKNKLHSSRSIFFRSFASSSSFFFFSFSLNIFNDSSLVNTLAGPGFFFKRFGVVDGKVKNSVIGDILRRIGADGVEDLEVDITVDEGTTDTGVDEGTIDTGVDKGTIDTGVDEGTIDTGVDEGTIDTGVEEGTIDTG